MLIPDVIDATTDPVERPETVAQRIATVADLAGRGLVDAGADCGFCAFAGFGAIDPDVACARLAAPAKGAVRASGGLRRRAA